MSSFLKICFIFIVVSFYACSSGSGASSSSSLAPQGDPQARQALLVGVNDFAYWIDGPDLAELESSDYDLVVVDYSADGSGDTEFSSAQIQALKDSGKVVLAYMSIGEAEDYRFYFDSAWVDGGGNLTSEAPDYLDALNPDWPGNYKVHYWESAWQTIIFSYLDRIIAAGFDGVYLDIIDAFEYFGPGGDSGLDRASAGEDMIQFVMNIADYARDTKGESSFLIFPQNGASILDESSASDYLEIVDGIGAEDTFYYGDLDDDNDLDLTNADQVTPYLDQFVAEGKIVLSVDYVQDPAKVSDFYQRAQDQGYIPYATVRSLDQLIINAGFEPD